MFYSSLISDNMVRMSLNAVAAKSDSTDIDLPVLTDEDKEELEKLMAEADSFSLTPHLVNLLLHEPFFSTLLRKVSKHKTTSISTAGVTIRDAEFLLLWNPLFVMKLISLQVRGLLKHECYHLIFKHCTGRKQDPHFLWNVATDLAINSLIPVNELPEGGLYPGKALDLSKVKDPESLKRWQKMSDLIVSFPTGKASEWYMQKLMEHREEIEPPPGEEGKPGEGEGGSPVEMDDHDGWGDLSDEDRQIAEGKLKQAVSDAVKRCDRNGQWGSVSAETRSVLRKMVNDSVNWKRVVQSFCGMSQRANKARTHKKVNRKYPYIHPGVKRGHSASVAVYMDQSGSVGDEEVEMFFGALNQLGRLTSFTLIPFDYSVDEKNMVKWRRGQKPPPVRHRSGGTSFHAVESHVKKNLNEFDGHIILTDGEASDPGPSRQRRCWVILPGCKLYFKPHPGDIVVTMDKQTSSG